MIKQITSTLLIGAFLVNATLAFANLSEESTTVSNLKLGDTLPKNYSFETVEGSTVDLESQTYPLLVSVFTTWCKVCKVELKELNDTAHKQDLFKNILVVNAGETPKRVSKYLKRRKLDLTTVIDSNVTFVKAHQVFGTPAIFLFDENKTLIYQGSELPKKWHHYLK